MAKDIAQEPTVEEVRTRIGQVDSLVAEGASVAELAIAIKQLHRGCSIRMAGLNTGDLVFRAVKIDSQPLHRSRVGYPPPEMLKKLGRANDIAQSMFYGTLANRHEDRDHDNKLACMVECRAEPGDIFALSTWEVIDEVILYPFGFHHPDILENPINIASGKATQPIITGCSPAEPVNLIKRWESKAFTREVSPGEEELYVLTVALTQYALNLRHPMGSFDRVAGVIYPSVANHLCIENICLRPEDADRALSLLGVQIFSMSDLEFFDCSEQESAEEPIGRVEAKIYDASYPCDGNPEIRWPKRAVLSSIFSEKNRDWFFK